MRSNSKGSPLYTYCTIYSNSVAAIILHFGHIQFSPKCWASSLLGYLRNLQVPQTLGTLKEVEYGKIDLHCTVFSLASDDSNPESCRCSRQYFLHCA